MKSAVYPHFFNAERIGESLKEVSSDVMRVESRDIVGRWFHSSDEADLFLWTDEQKQIVKQQISFYGQVVEWNAVEGTKTGVVIEEENSEQPTIKASEVIRFDERPQIQPVGLAVDVIQHISALTKDEQAQIIGNFSRGKPSRKSRGRFAQFLKKLFGA